MTHKCHLTECPSTKRIGSNFLHVLCGPLSTTTTTHHPQRLPSRPVGCTPLLVPAYLDNCTLVHQTQTRTACCTGPQTTLPFNSRQADGKEDDLCNVNNNTQDQHRIPYTLRTVTIQPAIHITHPRCVHHLCIHWYSTPTIPVHIHCAVMPSGPPIHLPFISATRQLRTTEPPHSKYTTLATDTQHPTPSHTELFGASE